MKDKWRAEDTDREEGMKEKLNDSEIDRRELHVFVEAERRQSVAQ